MRKICLLCMVGMALTVRAIAAGQVGADSVLTILQQKDSPRKAKALALTLRYYFGGRQPSTLGNAKKQLDSLLAAYPVPDGAAVSLFSETMFRMEQHQYVAAEKALVGAIGLAGPQQDHYLLYACFTQLSFLQSTKGYMTEAIVSFRQARKEAILLNDPYLQILVDINISDFYYRNKLYSQSLLYLDQAENMLQINGLQEPMFVMLILGNKADNYFGLGNADSLARYCRLLRASTYRQPRLYTLQQHSSYTLDLLQGRFRSALQKLSALKKDARYAYQLSDEQNLADALYNTGQLDSARRVAERLIADPMLKNHPEETQSLYKLLGRIAADRAAKPTGNRFFEQALQQAESRIAQLAAVDTVAARLQLDALENNYVRREEKLKQERQWLLFSLIVIGLVTVVAAVLYRSIRQKRHFERLLYEARREELSFINSHEVRRHLSNILGIIETITQSDDKHQGYLDAEAHLLKAAGDLDNSIRYIADRLNR